MQLRSSGLWLLLCSVWILHVPGSRSACARRGHPRCCSGRNNACTGVSPTGTTCYCDTYCNRSADCCEDYRGQCGGSVSHCVVGPWGTWSACSSRCGIGSRERVRQVSVPPRSGGNPCPDLRQRRGCYGEDPSCHTSKEVAKILPDTFKRDFRDPWRRRHTVPQESSPSNNITWCTAGITRYAPLCIEKYMQQTGGTAASTNVKCYCVYFRIKHVGPACRLQGWSRHLLREQLVCVECQAEASASNGRCLGDGLAGIRTFWTAASFPGCQGSWVQDDLREDCTCQLLSFVFV